MIKIMLVEDDKSLREIYGVRLLAEGYDIVSAGDGEEALAMAIKERPQLIISDVMMPKVSGYDMLDILRSTTETRGIKVIMMTALSSDEQRSRAESLGADRYLVKSQVGIEDVVRVVHEILGDGTTPVPTTAPLPQRPAAVQFTPPPVPVRPLPQVAPQPTVTQNSPQPVTIAPQPTPQTPPVVATPAVTPPAPTFATQPAAPQPAPQPIPAALTAQSTPAPVVNATPKPASLKSRIIQPLSDPNVSPVDINELLNKELAKEAGLTGSPIQSIQSASEEKAVVKEQLNAFQAPEPPTPVEAPSPIETPVVSTPPIMPTPGVTFPQSATVSPPTPTETPTTPTSDPAQPPVTQ